VGIENVAFDSGRSEKETCETRRMDAAKEEMTVRTKIQSNGLSKETIRRMMDQYGSYHTAQYLKEEGISFDNSCYLMFGQFPRKLENPWEQWNHE
jgi:hypothetical protein